MDIEKLKKVQDDIRALINWVEVFAKEHDLADEAKVLLEEKLREISSKIDLLDE